MTLIKIFAAAAVIAALTGCVSVEVGPGPDTVTGAPTPETKSALSAAQIAETEANLAKKPDCQFKVQSEILTEPIVFGPVFVQTKEIYPVGKWVCPTHIVTEKSQNDQRPIIRVKSVEAGVQNLVSLFPIKKSGRISVSKHLYRVRKKMGGRQARKLLCGRVDNQGTTNKEAAACVNTAHLLSN